MLYSLYATPFITAYSIFVVALLGLIMGSFLNCLAWRSTHGESVLKGRSHCDTCGHVLKTRDLVPIASWLSTHGKCRYCGKPISVRCPVTEALCAVAYVSILCVYDISLESLELMAFASILLVLSLTDLDDYVIPNGCIIAAIVVRVLYLVAMNFLSGVSTWQLFVNCAISAAVVGAALTAVVLVMDKVLGRESMGFGDVKLLAVASFYFGWRVTLFLIIVACVLGIIVGLVGQSHARAEENAEDEGEGADSEADEDADSEVEDDADLAADAHLIPWGPSIAAACWATMLVGANVVLWYMGLF